jgi:hypothetical protein
VFWPFFFKNIIANSKQMPCLAGKAGGTSPAIEDFEMWSAKCHIWTLLKSHSLGFILDPKNVLPAEAWILTHCCLSEFKLCYLCG